MENQFQGQILHSSKILRVYIKELIEKVYKKWQKKMKILNENVSLRIINIGKQCLCVLIMLHTRFRVNLHSLPLPEC